MSISLPKNTPPAVVPERRLATPVQLFDGKPVDILIAEDNEVNRIVFTQILMSTDFTFAIAKDGEEAVHMHMTHRPKVILMDVSMPRMNGYDATRAIRDRESHTGRRTPIIAVTAHALKGDMDKCLQAGMDDYLAKPVSPNALIKKLARWLDESGSRALA